MLTWHHSITFPVITYPCFQQRTDWCTHLNALLNHRFQCKERRHMKARSSNISQGWTQNPKLKLEVYAWVRNPTWDKPQSHLHNGIPKAKEVEALTSLATISECVLKHLQSETWCPQKFPAEEEFQHQEKYCPSTYCTHPMPKAPLSRELYLKTCLLSLGGT